MRRRWLAGILAWSCVCVASSFVSVPGARGAAAPLTVGVVEFYAPTPLDSYPGIVPESFATEDLSRLLARYATGQVTVIPAATMRHAEGDVRWRDADVLHFDRLRDLARAVSADRLVVRLIPQFNVDWGGDPSADGGKGPIVAEANVVVQVFDAGAGRLVGETRQFASSTGGSTGQVVMNSLHAVLERSTPALLNLLGVPGS